MKTTRLKIKVQDLVTGYTNNHEKGVKGYGGKLDIRPAYQREFIYNEKQEQDVINSVLHGFPLNLMYWVKRNDGTYEVLDGQQRTLALCDYYDNIFAYNYKYFYNLTDYEKDKFLNYELDVCVCEGNDKEKLEWFKIINIAGVKLTEQELRNAVYHGKWLTAAKKYFSKTNCPAYNLGKKYLKGSPIRQDYLETVLKWISDGHIEDYMAAHQFDADAQELEIYFTKVISWIQSTFVIYRNELKGLDFGYLYKNYKDVKVDVQELEKEIKALMENDEVTKKAGIYYYVFDRNEKHLNIRTFTKQQKRELYEKQNGKCAICGKKFDIEEMDADHIVPWSKGGKTTIDNGQLLCRACNLKKGNH